MTELFSFNMTTYNCKFVDVTVEDLEAIPNKLDFTNRTTSYNGLTYVLLFDNTLLAVNESYPTNKQLSANYKIDPNT